jgi:hypothetical protein
LSDGVVECQERKAPVSKKVDPGIADMRNKSGFFDDEDRIECAPHPALARKRDSRSEDLAVGHLNSFPQTILNGLARQETEAKRIDVSKTAAEVLLHRPTGEGRCDVSAVLAANPVRNDRKAYDRVNEVVILVSEPDATHVRGSPDIEVHRPSGSSIR